MTDTYTVADVVVTGQRRTAGSAAPFPTIESVEVRPKLDDEIGADEGMTLCDNPDLRRGDYRNIGPAIAGQHTGPEVNPDGDPCGQ